jgi:hypothetical protein
MTANLTAIEIWIYRLVAAIVLLFVVIPMFGFAAKVDVEIYKNVEDGEMTYCETGTLVDPPYQYMGSGKIDGDKASSC